MKATRCLILTLFAFVMLIFLPSSFAQDSRPIVRLIYFVPSDRQPQPDMDTKFDPLIKEIQQGYEGIMEAHGFGKKTFLFETDANGNAVVHTVNGRHPEEYYNRESYFSTNAIHEEIYEQFDRSKDFYLIAIDISTEQLGGEVSGLGGDKGGSAGWALMPASGPYFNIILAAHELGHAFGLPHDYRPDMNTVESNIYVFLHQFIATFCAAEWLDVHRAFNVEQHITNTQPTSEMLPPSLVDPPNVIRLRFKVTDSNGIHQVLLLTSEINRTGALLGCKNINGNTSDTVEFVTSSLPLNNKIVWIRMIDSHGNISDSPFYPIDMLALLPSPETISIPDPNLAALIRDTLDLAPDAPITQLNMLELTRLESTTPLGITTLKGLEHATQLRRLYLSGEQITDLTPISKLKHLETLSIPGNQGTDISQLSKLKYLLELSIENNGIISDITPLKDLTRLTILVISGNRIRNIEVLASMKSLRWLALGRSPIKDMSPIWELTNLVSLNIYDMDIRDLSPLTKLTELEVLSINQSEVSDISPIAELTNIKFLTLNHNKQLTDVSPLTGLVNLRELSLIGTPIKNRKPLLELLRTNPGIKIYLKNYQEPLPVTLSHFRAEHTDAGVLLKWTTESEVDNAGFYIYRSQTREGEFKVVNPTMIQGSGTTSERSTYTWKDTTAKPNTVYYYRIEDISHAGERAQLATVRLRGLVSATGKLTTRWADLKMQN